MKHKGSRFEYETARNRELMCAYREAQKVRQGFEVYVYTVACSTSRYWVSEERAYTVIRRMLEGYEIKRMNPEKRAMYQSILDEMERLAPLRPRASIYDLVFEVVNSPAPRFFLTPGSAKVILSRIRTGYYEARKYRSIIKRS